MSLKTYKKLLNLLVADIKSDLCNYPYIVGLDYNKHVSCIRILPIGCSITGTCTQIVMDVCKRHSLPYDFGCVIRDERPCFVVNVYNF